MLSIISFVFFFVHLRAHEAGSAVEHFLGEPGALGSSSARGSSAWHRTTGRGTVTTFTTTANSVSSAVSAVGRKISGSSGVRVAIGVDVDTDGDPSKNTVCEDFLARIPGSCLFIGTHQ